MLFQQQVHFLFSWTKIGSLPLICNQSKDWELNYELGRKLNYNKYTSGKDVPLSQFPARKTIHDKFRAIWAFQESFDTYKDPSAETFSVSINLQSY